MTKKEFLSTLEESLRGTIPMEEIDENVRYYKGYIEQSSKSERETLEELGDPRLIARTIVDSFKASKGPMADYYTEQARMEESSQVKYDDGYDYSSSRRSRSKSDIPVVDKTKKIVHMIIAAVAVIAVLIVLGAILGLLFKILVPIFVIVFLIRIIYEIVNNH